MIKFILDEDPNDSTIMQFNDIVHIPRKGDVVTLEDSKWTVQSILHDYTDGENVYVYLK